MRHRAGSAIVTMLAAAVIGFPSAAPAAASPEGVASPPDPPGIALTKTADLTTVSANDPVGYTLRVTNPGKRTAKNVKLTDALPAKAGTNWTVTPTVSGCGISSGTLTCGLGSLGAGQQVTVHVTSPTTFNTCGTMSNSATVSTTDADTGDSAGAGPVAITVQCPALSVAKKADAATVTAGAPIAYLITAANAGPGQAKSVTVTDTLPAAPGVSWSVDTAGSTSGCSIAAANPPTQPNQLLSCAFGNLGSGGSAHAHVTSLTTIATGGQTLANTANATAANDGGASHAASDTITVLRPAQLTVSPLTGLSFGPTTVGAGAPTQTFTITNTGQAASGPLADDGLNGPPTSGFTITSDQCSGQVLAGGATCDITVQFTPPIPGPLGASLSVSASPGGTVAAPVQGIGVGLTVDHTNFDFGSHTIGVPFSAAGGTYTFTNPGPEATPVALTDGISAPPNTFTVTNDTCVPAPPAMPAPLGAGASCSVTVQFTAQIPGPTGGSLQVGAGPGNSVGAGFNGTGVGLMINPTSGMFGSVAIGSSADLPFTISNPGPEATPVGLADSISSPGSTFTITADTCVPPPPAAPVALAAHTSCTVTVRFTPTVAGPTGGSLQVSAGPGNSTGAGFNGTGT